MFIWIISDYFSRLQYAVTFEECRFLSLLTNTHFYLVELLPLSELEMQMIVYYRAHIQMRFFLPNCLKVLLSEYFLSNEHTMSPRDGIKNITVPQTEL